MKRSILLALIAALALAVGANVATSAADGGAAQAAAKKKAAKCPAKSKKGKKKAGKAVADSAAKKKAKKKAAKCKAKPKKKAKAKPKAGAFKLADGEYRDTKNKTYLSVRKGGTTAILGSEISCISYSSESVPLTTSGDTVRASEDRSASVAGEPASFKWSLTVKSTLAYTFQISWDIGGGICKSQKVVKGKLVMLH